VVVLFIQVLLVVQEKLSFVYLVLLQRHLLQVHQLEQKLVVTQFTTGLEAGA
jgi:hypothetical protein